MGRRIAKVLGAMATLGAINAAQAAPMPTQAPNEALKAKSFAELLEPIPNATELLQTLDETQPDRRSDNVQRARYYQDHHHHHFYRY
jgi:hypothetical protein